MHKIMTMAFLVAFSINAIYNPLWGLLAYFALGLMFWVFFDFVLGAHRGWRTIFTWFPEALLSLRYE